MKETAITRKQAKPEIIQAIAEETQLQKKDVQAVFTALSMMIHRHMKKRGSGYFAVPEIGVKITKVKAPATKTRTGRNPATGDAIEIPARPAHMKAKVSALKKLKDMVD